jgi:hypothetical protein
MPRCHWCNKPALWQVGARWRRGPEVHYLCCHDCRGRAQAAVGNRQVDGERPLEVTWQQFLPPETVPL